MTLIALFPHEEKPSSLDLAKEISQFLQKHKISVVAEEEKASFIGVKSLSEVDHKKIKFLITLGGDGTILRLRHKYPALDVPIVGVNLGHLGFMADIPLADLYPSLQDLLSGDYTVENRLMLEGKTPSGEIFFAANDFVLQRGRNHNLIELSISVDGLYFNSFLADGLIFATPNGSTAYSLAAGGPILSPIVEALVVTPIAPHTLSNRPFVLPSSHSIEVQYLSSLEYPIDLWADGVHHAHINSLETFKLKKSNETFKLVRLFRRDFFSTLREKLGWAGKAHSF